MIYPLIFFVSAFLYAESNKENMKYDKVLWFLSLIVPVFLAAFRGVTIGTDIKTYVEPSYRIALASSSISSFLENNYYVTEILFNYLVFVSAKCFHSMQFLLGSIQFFISLPIYITIDRLVEKRNRTIALLAYYFVFYCFGLNMMRQFIAMSLCLLAFSCVVKGEKILTIIFILLAIGFHKSAVFAILLIIFYIVINMFNQNWIPYACGFITVVGTVCYEQIMRLVLNLFPNILGNYLGYLSGNQSNWPITDLLLYTLLLIIGINLLKGQDTLKRFCGLMSICSLAGIMISKTMIVAGRIMIYCNLFSIFNFSYANNIIKKDKDNQNFLKGIIIAVLVVYWLVQFVYLKNHQVYPYEFIWWEG